MSEQKIEYRTRGYGWLPAEEVDVPSHVPAATGEHKHLRVTHPDGSVHTRTLRPHGSEPGHWRFAHEAGQEHDQKPAERHTHGQDEAPSFQPTNTPEPEPAVAVMAPDGDDTGPGPSENAAENDMELAYESTGTADALGPGSVAHPRKGR